MATAGRTHDGWCVLKTGATLLLAGSCALAAGACGSSRDVKDVPPPPDCADEVGPTTSSLVDDFEDGDSLLPSGTNRHGFWYTVNDGTGTQAPAPDPDGRKPFLMSVPGSPNSPAYALRSVGWGFTGWGALVTVSLNASAKQLCSYDVSAYSGIRFQAKGVGSLRFDVGTKATTPVADGGECESNTCGDYGVPLDLSSDWREVTVPFGDLSQPSWATQTPWTSEAATRLTFWVERGDFDFWIDDVQLY